jgi:hypothetical protein
MSLAEKDWFLFVRHSISVSTVMDAHDLNKHISIRVLSLLTTDYVKGPDSF